MEDKLNVLAPEVAKVDEIDKKIKNLKSNKTIIDK